MSGINIIMTRVSFHDEMKATTTAAINTARDSNPVAIFIPVAYKKVTHNIILSHEVTSWRDIAPCIKIEKPLVVNNFRMSSYDVHYNIA